MKRLVAKKKMGVFYTTLLSRHIIFAFICTLIHAGIIYFINQTEGFNYAQKIITSFSTCLACAVWGYFEASKRLSSCISDGAPVLRAFGAVILFSIIPLPGIFFPFVIFLQAVLSVTLGVAYLVSEHVPIHG